MWDHRLWVRCHSSLRRRRLYANNRADLIAIDVAMPTRTDFAIGLMVESCVNECRGLGRIRCIDLIQHIVSCVCVVANHMQHGSENFAIQLRQRIQFNARGAKKLPSAHNAGNCTALVSFAFLVHALRQREPRMALASCQLLVLHRSNNKPGSPRPSSIAPLTCGSPCRRYRFARIKCAQRNNVVRGINAAVIASLTNCSGNAEESAIMHFVRRSRVKVAICALRAARLR